MMRPQKTAHIIAVLGVAGFGPAFAENASASKAEKNRAIVRQAFDDWLAGEAIFGRLLAEDISWTIHGSDPVAGVYEGRADFIERASRPLIERLDGGLVPEVHDIWADGDTVIIRFDGSATTRAGTAYENQFVWIFEMQDGLVQRAEAFLDLAAYREAVNSVP